MLAPAILFYDVVLAAHIACIILAFGVIFAYPIIAVYIQRNEPRSLPAWHRAQDVVGKRLVAPFGGLALLAGAYMASDRDYWSETWVTVPLIILLALLVSGGAFFGPTERRMAELAERDVAAAGDGPPVLSEEYRAVARRWSVGGGLACLGVLVAVFFMAAKPFA